jgi:hypothetical protein
LLNREFTRIWSDRAWSDDTFISLLKRSWLFLAVVIDLLSHQMMD